MNSNDQVVNTYQYDPFGRIEQANESVSQPLRFTGREYEPETGLYYYRARYYDPELGRFLSEDPIGLAGGINLYAYVGNDPVNARDPYGLYDPGDDLYYYVGSIGLELNATWIRRGYTVPVSTVAYFLNSIGSGPELPAEGCSVGEWYGGGGAARMGAAIDQPGKSKVNCAAAIFSAGFALLDDLLSLHPAYRVIAKGTRNARLTVKLARSLRRLVSDRVPLVPHAGSKVTTKHIARSGREHVVDFGVFALWETAKGELPSVWEHLREFAPFVNAYYEARDAFEICKAVR